MSLFTVVTSFSEAGWESYGRECVRSFREFWPSSVRLICYWEGKCPDEISEGWNLEFTEPCASFLERHKDNLIVQGKSQSALSPWGPKARNDGYSFRHDAYKFARKVFAVAHAAREVECGKLFWLDADTVTFGAFPERLLNEILPDTVSLAYLSRQPYHSELGFVGYNLDRIECHAFINAYEAAYSEDCFLRFPYWDDCDVFDALVRIFEPACALIEHTSRSQPFDNSILGNYMTHLKGRRKQ